MSDINPGINVIVGRNGAGKSNFFHAIRFVLGGPTQGNLSSLRSFGHKSQVKVEVVLANTGKNFFHLGNTVTITRRIGPSDVSTGGKSEDKYFVDERQVTKTEITSLLNAAGLSTDSGSYYIVPQGEIHRLATASDEEMFTILCNASGAATFDEKIYKSKNNLNQATAKIESSAEIAAKIEPIVNRMARDVEHLQERRNLTKELRGTQYLQHNLELLRTQFTIERETAKREGSQASIDESNNELQQREKSEQQLLSQLADAEAKVAETEAELDNAQRAVDQRKHELNKVHASSSIYGGDTVDVEMSLGEEQENRASEANSSDEIDDDLEFRELVNSQESLFASTIGSSAGSQYSQMSSLSDIDESEEELEEGTDPLDAANEKLQSLRQKLVAEVREVSTAKAKLRNLQLKEGRAKQLSPEECSEYQRKETVRVEKNIKELVTARHQEQAKLQGLETEKTAKTTELDSARSKLNETDAKINRLLSEQRETESSKTEADALKSSLFLSIRKSEIQRTRNAKSAEQQLKIVANGGSGVGGAGRLDIVRSIEAVQGAAKRLGLSSSQYFGTMAEVLDIESMVSDVVDRLAARQLLFHIVDSSDTVSKLVNELGSEVSASFVPLQELVVPGLPQYPSSEVEAGVSPLIEWVKPTDRQFEGVRNFVFGKYVVCDNLQTAWRIESKYNIPAVTMDGDICDTSGTISGGFSATGDGSIGNGETRINAIKELAQLYRTISDLDDNIVSYKSSITTETQRSVKCADRVNNVKAELMHASISQQNQQSKITDLQESVSLLTKQIDDCLQTISDCDTELSAAEQEKVAVSQRESFASELTQGDRDQMSELNQRIATLTESCQRLAKEEVEVFTRRMRAIHKRNKAASATKSASASTNGAANAINDDYGSSIHGDINTAKQLYADAVAVHERIESELARAHSAVDRLKKSAQNAHDELLKSSERNSEIITAAHHCTTKISVLTAFARKVKEELDQLGTVPSSALQQAEQFTADYNLDTSSTTLKHEVQKLDKQASKLQHELNKLEPVDPKVASDREQLVSDLEQLQASIKSLESERDSVMETIGTLEAQKSDKLQKSLEQISKSFGSIFVELSGGHSGSLVLERNSDSDDKVTGVNLEVSFGDATTQLSGGQRTICALALIFAIQACDSAPFYIFDEIDSNLDTQARQRVAEKILDLSKQRGVQFICTTFHPELVQVANAYFGVSYEQKKSVIEPIDRAMAIEFTSSD